MEESEQLFLVGILAGLVVFKDHQEGMTVVFQEGKDVRQEDAFGLNAVLFK